MRLSTGFMNGVTSLFVPNISLDHDNNVGGPTKMSNIHPLEVEDRGSETQLQVGGNSSFLI